MARAGGQLHSRWIAPIVERKLAARIARNRGYNLRKLADAYDRGAGIVGKVLMIVHVAISAFALALVHWRRRRYFVEHFAVALQLFTMLLLFAQLVIAPLNWLASIEGGGGGTSSHVPVSTPCTVGKYLCDDCDLSEQLLKPAGPGTLVFIRAVVNNDVSSWRASDGTLKNVIISNPGGTSNRYKYVAVETGFAANN